MKSNLSGWQPTLTLARLFEEQYQFFDALSVYEMLAQEESSPFLREKIEALHLRILRDPSASYDPRIERLFTAEELTYLKILNHNAFNNLSQVAERLQEAESLPDQLYEEDFSEEEGGEEAQKIMELISEIKEKAQLSILPDSQELGELTLQDLLVGILSRYATDTRLTEISFSDLISVFLELKLPHED